MDYLVKKEQAKSSKGINVDHINLDQKTVRNHSQS